MKALTDINICQSSALASVAHVVAVSVRHRQLADSDICHPSAVLCGSAYFPLQNSHPRAERARSGTRPQKYRQIVKPA